MSPRKRIVLLILIMTSIVLIAGGIAVGLLYNTAFLEEEARLQETARSQARMIEAVAKFDKIYSNDYPEGAGAATLSQIKYAHARYDGFGETGEFVLARRENDRIVFLLSHRHYDLDAPKPVPWNSELATPMRLALSGKSGTVIGLDYRGQMVLAAFEPVSELNLGIVTKIDLAEIRAPFIRAAWYSGVTAIAAILFGAAIFFRVTNPILVRLQDTVARLEKALKEVKTLRGIIPICSFCKKIRDDKGYWDQVDVYVKQHTEANFSHSVCPDCLKTHYSDELE